MNTLLNESTPPYSYGCAMANFAPENLRQVHEAWNYVDDDALSDEGIETDSHATLFYGLKDFDFSLLYNLIHGEYQTFPIEVNGIEIFKTRDGDCVHFRVEENKNLSNLRQLIRDNADCIEPTFPNYIPHITIAYVKDGMGENVKKKILDNLTPNFQLIVDNIVIADKNGRRHVIPLINSEDTKKEEAIQNIKNLFQDKMMGV